MKTLEISKLQKIYGGKVCDSKETQLSFIAGASLGGAIFGGIVGLALGANISTIFVKIYCEEA
ncbi:MAG: hypothetical protein WAT22_13510 [Saprospiraceae bacterium]